MKGRLSGKQHGVVFRFQTAYCDDAQRQDHRSSVKERNVDDREGARLLAAYLEEGSLCLTDMGYRGDDFQLEMFEAEGLLFLTRNDITKAELKKLHSEIRSRIETTFS